MKANQYTFEGTIDLLRESTLGSIQRFGRTRRIVVAVLLLSPVIAGLVVAGALVLTR